MNEFIVEVTNDNYESVIKSDKVVLVDFWATWCGPCRMLGPVIDKIAELNYGKVVVGKADIDEAEKTALSLGITSVPTMKIYVDGECVDTLVGFMPEGKIQATLDKYIK